MSSGRNSVPVSHSTSPGVEHGPSQGLSDLGSLSIQGQDATLRRVSSDKEEKQTALRAKISSC